MAKFRPGNADPYQCLTYTTCGTLSKDCTDKTYVLTIETLTPDTTPSVPCPFCDGYPISAKDATTMPISNIPFSALGSGKEEIVSKATLDAKFEISPYPEMVDFCPLYKCTNYLTNTSVKENDSG